MDQVVCEIREHACDLLIATLLPRKCWGFEQKYELGPPHAGQSTKGLTILITLLCDARLLHFWYCERDGCLSGFYAVVRVNGRSLRRSAW